MDSTRVFILDGDVLLYEVVHQTTLNVDAGDGMWQQLGDAKTAADKFMGRLRLMMDTTGCEKCVVTFSAHGSTFRHDVYPSYKHRRDHAKKRPIHFNATEDLVRESLDEASIPWVTQPSLEADDLIGILATATDYTPVIATIDKDLDTIPGEHFNTRTHKTHNVSPQSAHRFFMQQTIQGDSVDDIPGCRGIGKVRAARAVDRVPLIELWDTVLSTYEKADQTPDDAILNARLVYILRAGDFNFETGEVTLWTPESISSVSDTESRSARTPSHEPSNLPANLGPYLWSTSQTR